MTELVALADSCHLLYLMSWVQHTLLIITLISFQVDSPDAWSWWGIVQRLLLKAQWKRLFHPPFLCCQEIDVRPMLSLLVLYPRTLQLELVVLGYGVSAADRSVYRSHFCSMIFAVVSTACTAYSLVPIHFLSLVIPLSELLIYFQLNIPTLKSEPELISVIEQKTLTKILSEDWRWEVGFL